MFEQKEELSVKTDELFENYKLKKNEYYTSLFREQDKLLLSQISKIPDSWDTSANQDITEESKRRLSDIKRYKSWELRLEIFYMYYLVDIEDSFLKTINCRNIDPADIDETIDSLNSILTELESNLIDFRYLLLSIAKRSISDLYYLAAAYTKFFSGREFDYESDFPVFMKDILSQFSRYKSIIASISLFNSLSSKIDIFFMRTSNYTGLRLDENLIKKNETMLNESNGIIPDLAKMLPIAFSIKTKIKRNYDFLKFYYNKDSGRLFRYNYILENMKTKVDTGRTKIEIFEKFTAMRTAFCDIKYTYDMNGFEYFGFNGMQYGKLVDFIYKGSKILEYFYLRNSKYEDLQNLRNSILVYIENEHHKIGNIQAR
ncbi:MAG: hypothetical protein KA015_03880 [Spirochaetes bacterium]|nr:hypothetical protein [Spirochaetota bacterium]